MMRYLIYHYAYVLADSSRQPRYVGIGGSSYIITMCSQAVTVCSFSPSIYAQGLKENNVS
jgi:hypothetical protein